MFPAPVGIKNPRPRDGRAGQRRALLPGGQLLVQRALAARINGLRCHRRRVFAQRLAGDQIFNAGSQHGDMAHSEFRQTLEESQAPAHPILIFWRFQIHSGRRYPCGVHTGFWSELADGRPRRLSECSDQLFRRADLARRPGEHGQRVSR